MRFVSAERVNGQLLTGRSPYERRRSENGIVCDGDLSRPDVGKRALNQAEPFSSCYLQKYGGDLHEAGTTEEASEEAAYSQSCKGFRERGT